MARRTVTDEERVVRYFRSLPAPEAARMLRMCHAIVEPEKSTTETPALRRVGRPKKVTPEPEAI